MDKKRLITLVVIFYTLIFIFPTTTAFGQESLYFEKAEDLNQLGLFQGSGNDYELERAPNRLEGGVILIRLLGKEDEVLASDGIHPFRDVPQWANAYVAYLYDNNLTNGITADLYGSGKTMDAKSYITFVLRALGYDDVVGDFHWREALKKAKTIGLIDETIEVELQMDTFLRGHMVLVSHRALDTELKDETDTLKDKLIKEGVIKEDSILHEKRIKVPEVSSNGIVIFRAPMNGEDVFTVHIARGEVDNAVKDFAKIAVPGAPKTMDFKELVEEYTDFSAAIFPYNTAGWGSQNVDFQSRYYTIFFYDEEENMLGYYSIDPGEIVTTGGKYLRNVRVVFEEPHEGMLRALDFDIIRRIHGEKDPEFNWTGGVTYSGLEDGFQEDITFGYLPFEDGTEYEIIPKDSKIKIKSIEVL